MGTNTTTVRTTFSHPTVHSAPAFATPLQAPSNLGLSLLLPAQGISFENQTVFWRRFSGTQVAGHQEADCAEARGCLIPGQADSVLPEPMDSNQVSPAGGSRRQRRTGGAHLRRDEVQCGIILFWTTSNRSGIWGLPAWTVIAVGSSSSQPGFPQGSGFAWDTVLWFSRLRVQLSFRPPRGAGFPPSFRTHCLGITAE